MKLVLSASAVLISLTVGEQALAKSIRADNPYSTNACQIKSWSGASLTAAPTSGDTFAPGGITLGNGALQDTEYLCSLPDTGNNTNILNANDPDAAPYDSHSIFYSLNGGMSPNGAAGFNENLDQSQYPSLLKNPSQLATSGFIYEFLSNSNPPLGSYDGQTKVGGSMDVQIIEWKIGTSGYELELNGWCTNANGPGAAGAGAFTFGGKTYKGGCGSSAADDFLFDANKNLVGWVDSKGTVVTDKPPPVWEVPSGGGGGGTVSAPELDPISFGSAMTLLLSVVLVTRGRRKIP